MGHNGNQVTRLRTMLEEVNGTDSGYAPDCYFFLRSPTLFRMAPYSMNARYGSASA